MRLLSQSGQKSLVAFIVAGFPSLEVTARTADTLASNGVDVLELGVPFSDPMADGPVIQNASSQAAAQGITCAQVLELGASIKTKNPQMAIVIFTYYNPILKMGLTSFAKAAQNAGVDACLTVDLPVDESNEYQRVLKENEIGTIFLASPTTSKERLSLIAEASTSFVYCISRTGVTGVQNDLSSTLPDEMAKLRSVIKLPLALGFGISNGNQAAQAARLADAVVVGSAFVKIMADSPSELMQTRIAELAKELKTAIIKS